MNRWDLCNVISIGFNKKQCRQRTLYLYVEPKIAIFETAVDISLSMNF